MNYKKARTKLDKIKLMTYIQQSWREEKKTKKLMCINYTTPVSL